MGFTTEPQDVRPVNGGVQRRYRFGNGYRASVIQSPYSYGGDQGLWEIAVLDASDKITYGTPITDDVIGYLTEDEVEATLTAIAALPAVSA